MIEENDEMPKSAPEGSGGDDSHAEIVPLVKRKGIGRNDLCPCNSGDKYKNCHEKADKMLMPREMANLLKIIVIKMNGVTILQSILDNFPEDVADITITYDEEKQAWVIHPDIKMPSIVTPNKEPVIPTRRILKPS